MRFFDFLSRKESRTSAIIVQQPGRAAWSKIGFEKLAKEGYQSNVVAYQAINRVADAVASIKWALVTDSGEPVESHPILDAFARPNQAQSWAEFVRATVSNLLLGGNAFVERIHSGSLVEFYSLRPDRMKVIEGKAWPLPLRYEYRAGGSVTRWDVDQVTGESDILQIKLYNPTNDWLGMPPMQAGAKAVDQHNEAMEWIQALLQNSARPSGAIVAGADTPISDEQFARLKAEIEAQYSGSRNAGRPMLLEGGLDWKEMGLSPTDMGVMDIKNSAARDICLAFGVPPQLLGIPGDNTYSNYREARLAFWEDTVIPLAQMIGSEFTAWMRQIFDGIRVDFDMDDIPAIADRRATFWEMADKAKDLTLDERRDLRGYPPIPGGTALPEFGFDSAAEQQANIPGDTQQMALNGAQMASIQSIVQAVADGMMPAESAVRVLTVSIPILSEDEARAIIAPAEDFEPNIDFTGGGNVEG